MDTKYWLPEFVTLKEGQDLPKNKTEKRVFIDSRYGEFLSSFALMQDPRRRRSMHPECVKQRLKKSPETVDKWRKTLSDTLSKEGIINVSQRQGVRAKAKQTMVERYGVAYAMQSPEFQEKQKSTNLEKYGVSVACNRPGPKRHNTADSIRKMIETKKAKYGMNPLNTEEQKKATHEARVQRQLSHVYPNGQTPKELAAEFNVPLTTVNRIYREDGFEVLLEWAKSYKKTQASSLEIKMKKLLSDAGISVDSFNKTVPGTGNFKPDFKLTDKLFLEVDGLAYHDETKKNNMLHYNKREVFESQGLEIIQIRQDEIRFKPSVVISLIKNKLGLNKKIYARKTELREVTPEEGAAFNNENHLMGAGQRLSGLGLYHNDVLVFLITLKKHKDNVEIVRMASKIGTTVIGGFSKVLSKITKDYKGSSILSFVDLRYANGNSLEKLGFLRIATHLSWKWSDGIKTYNRLFCRANMDARRLSEKEHAKELGLTRIYDAGQAKYVLKHP